MGDFVDPPAKQDACIAGVVDKPCPMRPPSARAGASIVPRRQRSTRSMACWNSAMVRSCSCRPWEPSKMSAAMSMTAAKVIVSIAIESPVIGFTASVQGRPSSNGCDQENASGVRLQMTNLADSDTEVSPQRLLLPLRDAATFLCCWARLQLRGWFPLQHRQLTARAPKPVPMTQSTDQPKYVQSASQPVFSMGPLLVRPTEP